MGFFGNISGMSECEPCVAGSYWNQSGATSSASLKNLVYSWKKSKAHDVLSKFEFLTIKLCPLQVELLDQRGDECLPCLPGTASQSGSASCSECEAGRFAAAGAGSCSPCPPGEVALLLGSGSCTWARTSLF